MPDKYCGRCHTWMKPRIIVHGQVEAWYCECPIDQEPDTSKDPNCHNSNHDHHDPQSPIVLSRQVEYEAEEKAEAAAEARWAEARDKAEDKGHAYHVAVFDSSTGILLGWRPLDEPEIDDETRAELDAILREANEMEEADDFMKLPEPTPYLQERADD